MTKRTAVNISVILLVAAIAFIFGGWKYLLFYLSVVGWVTFCLYLSALMLKLIVWIEMRGDEPLFKSKDGDKPLKWVYIPPEYKE